MRAVSGPGLGESGSGGFRCGLGLGFRGFGSIHYAVMSGQDFDVDVLRLRRFLHTGLDPVKNFYCSPDDVSTEMISFKKEYDDLDGLLESLAAKGKGDLIASEILKAHSSDSSPHRRAVIYVLGRAISMGARDAVLPCPLLDYERFECGVQSTPLLLIQ